MYLLVCSKYQLARFNVILANARFDYKYLNLLDTQVNQDMIEVVKSNISNYKQVLVSSELVAHHLIEVFQQHYYLEYIAVGKVTGDYLLNNGLQNTRYPIIGSGLQAVFDAKLLDDSTQVMYLTCDKEYTNAIPLHLDIYPVYKHVTIPQDNENVKNIILNQELEGIIITSKKFVDELFNLANNLGVVDILLKHSYIVIHENIRDRLVQLGVNKIKLSCNINQISELLG